MIQRRTPVKFDDRLAASHELRSRVGGLMSCFEHHPERRDVVARLDDLCERLRERFRQEEEGGYLEEVLPEAPRLAAEAERLRHQHQELLERLARLERLAAHSGDGSGWSAMEKAAARFREELERHERAESGLIQETLTTDLGAQD